MLSENNHQEIRALFNGGVTQKKIAEQYGVSRATIQNSLRGYYLQRNKPAYNWGKLTEEEWKLKHKDSMARLQKRALRMEWREEDASR